MNRHEKYRLAKKFDRLAELFEDGERWIQGTLAVDEDYNNVSPKSPKCAGFCLIGGIEKVTVKETVKQILLNYVKKAVENKVGKYHYFGIASFNDRSTTDWKDVKKVIAMAKEKFLEENSAN